MSKIVQVSVRNNVDRKTLTLSTEKSVKECFQEASVDFNGAMITMDGMPITASDLNKSLDELGIKDSVTFTAIVKTNNAAF